MFSPADCYTGLVAFGNDLLLGLAPKGKRVILPASLRNSHLYVCGASRTGKSKLLEHLIRQDISNRWKSGCGLMLIDWHGSLYDSLMKWLAWHDIECELPILPIDLRRKDFVVGYHLLRKRKKAYDSVVVSNLLQDLAYAWGQGSTNGTPRFARIAGDLFHVLYEHGLTLSDSAILMERRPTPLKVALTEKVSDRHVREDWHFLNSLKPEKAEEFFESTVNRLRRFIANPLMRAMLGQDGESLDLRKALDEGHIILVSLARGEGKASAEDCETLATLLLSDLWAAAQERDKAKNPKPFYLYLDEFQRLVTPTLAENLDEAGGFGLHLTMAHQFPTQLLDRGAAGQKVYNSVMANAATKVVFRTAHQNDLEPLANELFMGVLDPDEVKLVIHSTKVLDYEEESRTVTTVTTGSSQGDVTPKWAEDGDEDHGSTSVGESTVESEQEQYFLRPVMGEEISQVHYRSLAEQLHAARAKINTLRRRHCIARLAESSTPISFRTADVEEGWADDKRLKRFTTKHLKKWKFVLPFEKAAENLARREKELEKRFLTLKEDAEPKSFRRKVK